MARATLHEHCMHELGRQTQMEIDNRELFEFLEQRERRTVMHFERAHARLVSCLRKLLTPKTLLERAPSVKMLLTPIHSKASQSK